ncbi:MAG: DNA-protecting protein DprA [Alphaproteobacteria bacterium]|jgi:DNA processing protein|nr:DNA-protecting protein DprA [Alphaproteobacteria bacterium]
MVDADANLRALLRLARTTGVGPGQLARLMARHGSAAAAVAALEDLGPGTVRLAAPAKVEAEIEATLDAGARFLARGDPDYPPALAAADQAPGVLTVKGDPALLGGRLVGMVGARNASAGGRKLAREIAAGLAGEGVGVVSGLARGIDTAAHEGAIGHGVTVAVVATGIDVVYPAENAELAAAIAASGVIVTERPFGAKPQASQFPRRNRLISGLAQGVLVVEAAPRSGSLITARFAADQGREVMAVPGSPLDERHRGTNRLLREGAHLVESAADVLAVLAPFAVAPPKAAAPRKAAAAPPTPAAPRSQPDRERAPAPAAATPPAAGALEAEIRARLALEPVPVDELIRQCHASPAEVQHALMDLELAGEVERHSGNRVSLVVV